MENDSCLDFILPLFFLGAASTGLYFGSGAMLVLGAYVQVSQGNKEYDIYNSNLGFEIGKGSFFPMQFVTVAVLWVFSKVAKSIKDTDIAEKVLAHFCITLLTSGSFAFFHYKSLPVAEKAAYGCLSIDQIFSGKSVNTACEKEDYSMLYSAFFTGFGISLAALVAIYSVLYMPILWYIKDCKKNPMNEHENDTPNTPDNQTPEIIVNNNLTGEEPVEMQPAVFDDAVASSNINTVTTPPPAFDMSYV